LLSIVERKYFIKLRYDFSTTDRSKNKNAHPTAGQTIPGSAGEHLYERRIEKRTRSAI